MSGAPNAKLIDWVHKLSGASTIATNATLNGVNLDPVKASKTWLDSLGGLKPPIPLVTSLSIIWGIKTAKPINPDDEDGRQLNKEEWAKYCAAIKSNEGLTIACEVDWQQGPGVLPGREIGSPMNASMRDILKGAALRLRLEMRYAVHSTSAVTGGKLWRVGDVVRIARRPESAELVSESTSNNRVRVTWNLSDTATRPYADIYMFMKYPPAYFISGGSGIVFAVIGAGPSEPGRNSAGIGGALDFVGQAGESQFPLEIQRATESDPSESLAATEWLGVGWDQL